MADFDLARLENFRVFARYLNFTRAARALHLTQPALHAQVRLLSEELGVPLYRREGRRLVLTPEGVEAAAFAGELGERCRAFAGALRGEAGAPVVVLAAGEGAYLYLLGEPIRAFVAGAQARLTLLTRGGEGAVEALRSGEAHLGVAALSAVPEGLRARPLAEVGCALVLPEGHPLAGRAQIALADLEGARLVVPPAGRPHRVLIERHLAAAGVGWQVAVEAHGWPLMLRFVALGMGLAIVNDCCHLPLGLVARPVPALPGARYLLLAREGRILPPVARALEQLLVERVTR